MGVLFGLKSLSLEREQNRSVVEILSRRSSLPLHEFNVDGWTFYLAGEAGRDYLVEEQVILGLDGVVDFIDEPSSSRETVLAELVRQFNAEGVQYFSQLAGSFSLFIFDRQKERLYLLRDAVGSKPLYYCDEGNHPYAFSSSLNALVHSKVIAKELSLSAVNHYLSFLSVPDPDTIYKNIYHVKAGTVRHYQSDKGPQEYRYFSFPDPHTVRRNENDGVENLREALINTILRYERYADEPVSLLSGGYDTSAIVGIMSRFSKKRIKTITIGYGQGKYKAFNEFDHARKTAHHFKTDHYEFNVSGKLLKDHLIDFVWNLEQPSGDAINNYLAFLVGSEIGNRIFTGFGGDEIFIGSLWYVHYLRIHSYSRNWRKLPEFARSIILQSSKYFPMAEKVMKLDVFSRSIVAQYTHMRFLFSEAEKIDLFEPEVREHFIAQKSSSQVCDDYFQCSEGLPHFERFMGMLVNHEVTNMQLRDLDLMAHAHGSEAFSPLMDLEILKVILTLPLDIRMKGNVLRYPMIKALHDILPEMTRGRKKMSFIVPMVHWARSELEHVIRELLSRRSVRRRGHFCPDKIEQFIRGFYENDREKLPYNIWHLALLELWERIHIDNDFSSPPDFPIEEIL